MESPPPMPPYETLATGLWPDGIINPNAISNELIQSGVIHDNYPAPSYGAVPLLPPVPAAPPLDGPLADALGALAEIPRERIAVLVPGAIALGLIAAGVAILAGSADSD